MNALPTNIMDAIFSKVLGDRPSAFLELDLNGQLIHWGGEIGALGFDDFQAGMSIEEHIDLLTGMLDPDQMPIDLPFMPTPSGITTDIHLFQQTDRIWVLFVYAEDKAAHQRAVQQRVNDLSLTHHRQSRILNQYLGQEVAQRLEEGLEHIERRGERRKLTILFADIRGFSSYAEHTNAEEVFDVLNIYLGAMIPLIMENGGVLDKIIGDEVMAIFGMLPGDDDGAEQGMRAAIDMLGAVQRLNRQRRHNGETVLEIGIGMATGPVTLGVLGSEHRKSITVIGNHVNLAARLQGQAQARQLIIDANCLDRIAYAEYFRSRQASLKGYSSPIEVFLLESENLEKLAERLQQGAV